MMMKGNLSSLLVLNKKIKVCLVWDDHPLMGHVVPCKRLRDKELHTFLGMVGYCMKDNMEEHFEFVHHNVSSYDMNEGKMEYAKFSKVSLKNHVNLFDSNILQWAHQRARFHMEKHPGISLLGVLFHMCKSEQFYLNLT